MVNMALLKLMPSFKDYLWGGHRLADEYNKKYDGEILAESWELSCHPDGPSVIANGKYAGKTLKEFIDLEGKEVQLSSVWLFYKGFVGGAVSSRTKPLLTLRLAHY